MAGRLRHRRGKSRSGHPAADRVSNLEAYCSTAPRFMKTLDIFVATDRYELRLAEHIDEIVLAQRLRYEVFNLELHEGLPGAFETGIDADEFDEVCDHLIVCERATGTVVGTYRMQTGANAA